MSQRPQQPSERDPGRQRLQRVLASAGVTSRRKAEEMIVAGRVSVDGRIVTELGTTVNPERQRIAVDGQTVKVERRRYILLNKPKGYITTVADERGRQTVMDLVDVPERVKPVGRLDRPSEGLLLFTNDGELAFRIMHPRYEIEKEYEVELDGHPPPDALERVRRGITLDGERISPSMVRPMRNGPDGTIMKVVIHEGRNRVVRRMFDEIGYPVLRLQRTRIGPLQIGSIPRGAWRELTPGELEQIRQAVRMDEDDFRPPRPVERERPRSSRAGAQRGSTERRGGPPSRGGRRPDDRGPRPSGGPPRRRDDRRSSGPNRDRPPQRARPQGGGPRRGRPPGSRPPERPDRSSAPPDKQQPKDQPEKRDE